MCDATETGGMPPVTWANNYHTSSSEAAGCTRMNQRNFPPTEWLMAVHGLRDKL